MEIAVPAGYLVEQVTEQTLQKGYKNEGMFINRLEEWWDSLDAFF